MKYVYYNLISLHYKLRHLISGILYRTDTALLIMDLFFFQLCSSCTVIVIVNCVTLPIYMYMFLLHVQMFFGLKYNYLLPSITVPPLSISQDLVDYIDRCTRRQRDSDMWQRLHIGRLTSSLFGEALSAGDNPKSLIRRIAQGSGLQK
jgi:hypothetical protein